MAWDLTLIHISLHTLNVLAVGVAGQIMARWEVRSNRVVMGIKRFSKGTALWLIGNGLIGWKGLKHDIMLSTYMSVT